MIQAAPASVLNFTLSAAAEQWVTAWQKLSQNQVFVLDSSGITHTDSKKKYFLNFAYQSSPAQQNCYLLSIPNQVHQMVLEKKKHGSLTFVDSRLT